MANLRKQADMAKSRRNAEVLHDPYDMQQRGMSNLPPEPTMTMAEIRERVSAYISSGADPNVVTVQERAQLVEQARRIGHHGHDPDPYNETPNPVVYYFRVGNRIKIGFTTSLRRRVETLMPEEVLATEPGSYELERQRHNEFADYHVNREWFTQGPRLLEHIVKLRGGRA